MSKSKGVSRLFLSITAVFTEAYTEAAQELGILTMMFKNDIRKRLNKKAKEMLGPIIDNYFKDGIAATNKIMPANISRLIDQTKIPFKYNRALLETFNTRYSAFTGYYSNQTKQLFKLREIDALKRVILTGKYSNWTDQEFITSIRKVVNVTHNRALVIARQETARLNTAATQIYYNKKKVRDEYELVWVCHPDARPTHMSYNGQIADEDGVFNGDLGHVQGGPLGFGCRCRIVLRKKSKDTSKEI